ncbi:MULTISPECIES: YgiT-type zinc finger protein [Spirulina sp. CCY15215]|uniref:YgiT-type zinc finger protein n=1 Tax=Spirulina sp. CCY15215 TaxID=2767591 RepID=UPI00195225AB|nr:YgiT-type zinc finger protein [Spirulina major]
MFKCHACHSEEFHLDQTSEIFQIEGKFYLVENIPMQVCSRCGEMVFSRETTEQIRAMLHSDTKPVKSIAVDVFNYSSQSKAS